MRLRPLVPFEPARELVGRLTASAALYTALIEADSVSMALALSPETWTDS